MCRDCSLKTGCQTWTRTKTSGLTDRRATFTPSGNCAAAGGGEMERWSIGVLDFHDPSLHPSITGSLPPGARGFNKEQTPLGDLYDPNPRFHGGSFGVYGHTSSEALRLQNLAGHIRRASMRLRTSV